MLISHKNAGDLLAALVRQFVVGDDEAGDFRLAQRLANLHHATISDLIIPQIQIVNIFFGVLLH